MSHETARHHRLHPIPTAFRGLPRAFTKIKFRISTNGRTTFDNALYKRRAIMENVIGWLKECRRVGARFEKPANSFQAMLQLALIQRILKIAFCDRAWSVRSAFMVAGV